MNPHTTQDADAFAAWMDRKRRRFGQDAAYTARWDESLWRAAWGAEKALEYRLDVSEGFYVLHPNEAIPEWLRKKLVSEVWQDFDTPAPVLGVVPCHLGDWFTWATEHPAELTLAMSDPVMPSTIDTAAVHQAWELAREHGAIPLLWIGLEPKAVPGTVLARLRGLYVVTRTGEPNVTPDIDRILGFRGATAPVYSFDLDEVRDKALWFNDPEGSTTDGTVVFWDWMTDRPDRPHTHTTTQPSHGDDGPWTCAVAPSCIPDEPGGTLNGLSDCSGCGNQMWVGYASWCPDHYDLDGALERLIHGGASDDDGKALAAALAELYGRRARDEDRLARDRCAVETSEREIAPFVFPGPTAPRSTTPSASVIDTTEGDPS